MQSAVDYEGTFDEDLTGKPEDLDGKPGLHIEITSSKCEHTLYDVDVDTGYDTSVCASTPSLSIQSMRSYRYIIVFT